MLTQQFHLTRAALPPIIASSFVGMFFGATLLGRFADRARPANGVPRQPRHLFRLHAARRVQRRTSPMLIVTRFLAGIGIGAELPLVDAYLSELLPARHRGRYTAWAYTLGFIGVPAAGFLARILVPRQPLGIDGWRWMFVAGSLGAAIVWALRAKLPESPRWLESVGRTAEADAIVSRMEREAEASRPAAAADHRTKRHRSSTRRFRTIFGAALSRTHADAVRLPRLSDGRLLRLRHARADRAGGEGLFDRDVADVHVADRSSAIPIGSALSLPIVERVDRRWLIVGSAALMSRLRPGTRLRVSAGRHPRDRDFSTPPTSNIFSNALHIFQVEIFPTFARATAAGTAYGMSRLSTGAMPFVLVPVLDRLGPDRDVRRHRRRAVDLHRGHRAVRAADDGAGVGEDYCVGIGDQGSGIGDQDFRLVRSRNCVPLHRAYALMMRFRPKVRPSRVLHCSRPCRFSRIATLEAWKIAMDLVVAIYGLTKAFPREELYGLQLPAASSRCFDPFERCRRPSTGNEVVRAFRIAGTGESCRSGNANRGCEAPAICEGCRNSAPSPSSQVICAACSTDCDGHYTRVLDP